MNNNQKKIYDSVTSAIGVEADASKITVKQTPSYLKEPISVADFITGVVAALGAAVDKLGQLRGLPAQEIGVDRRLATLSLNNAMFDFMNGVAIQGGEITVPVNSFFQDKNGKWMCTNGAYPQLRDGILKYFNAPHYQPALIEAVAKHDLDKIEEDFEELGLCVAPFMTHEEWLQHPQGQAMAKHNVVMVEKRADGPAGLLANAKYRPLEGVKVVDVTHVVAGPWATRVLADHGADVISVRNGAFPMLYPMIFEESCGKKQILLDFKIEREKERFIELVKTADVLVWGYGPGSLDRLGLTTEKLMELNPNLVITRETAYGPTGPWKNRKGWEQLCQTHSGMVDLASRGRKQKHLVAALPLDYGTGYLAAIGTIGALIQRQENGGFYEVNAMLGRTAMEILELPKESEDAVPISADTMGDYLIDQVTDFRGAILTRLKSALELSHTPPFCATGPAINGTDDAWNTTWDTEVKEVKPSHYPSKMLARGLSPGLIPGFGHEDIMHRPE
jgi:crotonobetainyl-CoA:carnitine CoA-transferase CaiB-like acyl-CoA transferase